MIVLLIILAFVVGATAGYVFAVARTDHLLAQMSATELRALAARVRRRKG